MISSATSPLMLLPLLLHKLLIFLLLLYHFLSASSSNASTTSTAATYATAAATAAAAMDSVSAAERLGPGLGKRKCCSSMKVVYVWLASLPHFIQKGNVWERRKGKRIAEKKYANVLERS